MTEKDDEFGMRVQQNTGVLDQQEGAEEGGIIINGELVPPGSMGKTEGGMPLGTPPVAPPTRSLGKDVTPVEDTEAAMPGSGPELESGSEQPE